MFSLCALYFIDLQQCMVQESAPAPTKCGQRPARPIWMEGNRFSKNLKSCGDTITSRSYILMQQDCNIN